MKRKKWIIFISAAVLFSAAVMSTVSCGSGKEELAFAGKISSAGRESSLQEDVRDGELSEREEERRDFSEVETEPEYPLVPWNAESNYLGRSDYIFLQDMDQEKHCRVEAGDTLWEIAEDCYGTGEAWTILMEANGEEISDENLILPGMELSVPENCFIRKQSFSRGGFSSSACSYDVPRSWVAGRPGWEICLEYSWYPEEENYGVYTHVTQNRLFPEGTGDAWESIQQKIIEVSEESKDISFSLPVFERYRRTDGRELLFYQFVAEAGESSARFAVAYVPGEKYLAEFIGICPLTVSGEEEICDITGITRYMAASYREEGGEKEWDSLKTRPYLGADSWPFEDLHNPFGIAAELFGTEEETEFEGEDGEVSFVSEEWEELLRKMVCYHFDYSDEQRKEFMERPHASVHPL